MKHIQEFLDTPREFSLELQSELRQMIAGGAGTPTKWN